MAIPIAKAFVDVELNQRAFMSGLAGSQAAFTKTTGSMQARAAATSAAITKSFVAATAGLALLGGVVIMGVKAAAKYETAWREVWTLMSITEDQMKSLADATSRLSVSYGEAETSGLKALYQITSAGFMGAEAMIILEESLKGAVGGVSDVFTAADILTGALNAWNIAAGQSAYVMDLIFTTIKEGKVTMDSLAAGAGRVMAIAGPFGISMEEAFGALAALTKPLGGVHLAATALVASIRAFLKPQEELNELIKEMGYETGRTLVEEKGLAGAILAVTEAAEAAGIPLEVLFSNVRAMMGVMPLATTMSEEYARILDSMFGSAENASAAVEKMMQTFEMQWSIFSKTLGRAKRLFGEAFLPIFTSGLEKMIPYVEKLAEYFRQSGDAVRYFVMHGLKVLGIIVAVAGLAKAFLLLMRPIGLLIAAAALLYGAWYFNLFGIRGMVEQVGEILTEVVLAPLEFALKIVGAEGAAASLRNFMTNLNKSLVGVIAAVGGFVLGAWLVKGLLGKLAGATLAGGILTLPALAILAVLAWDIFNTIGKITEGAGWPTALELGTRALGMILGAVAGALVGGAPGAVIGAAAGYAFAISVQALVEITWDVMDKFGKEMPTWVREGLFGPTTKVPFEFERYQRGGLIPGARLGDQIPALLEPGEFVIPRWMMEMPEIAAVIEGIWSGAARFQAGGGVGVGAAPIALARMPTGTFQAYIESLTQSMPSFLKVIVDYIAVHGQARERVVEFAEMLNTLFIPLGDLDTEFSDLLAKVEADIQAEMEKAEALAKFTLDLKKWGDVITKAAEMVFGPEVGRDVGIALTGIIAAAAGDIPGVVMTLLNAVESISGFMKKSVETAFAYMEKTMIWTFDRIISIADRLVGSFQALWKQTDTYRRLQSVLQGIQQTVFNTLLGFLMPLVAVLEALTGAIKTETAARFEALGVPAGFKGARYEWRAAEPGVPYRPAVPTVPGLPPWIEDLLAKFKDLLEPILDLFSQFISILQEAWEVVGSLIIEGILPALKAFGEGLLALAEHILTDLVPLLTEFLPGIIKNALDFFFGAITGVATFFVDTLTTLLPNLSLFFEQLGILGALLPGLFAALSEALSPVFATLIDAFTAILTWVNTVLAPDLKTFFTAFGKWWRTEVDPFLQKEVFPTLGKWLLAFYNWIKNDLLPFLERELMPAVKTVWAAVKPAFEGLGEALGNLWNTIKENMPTITAFLSTFIGAIIKKWTGMVETLDAFTKMKSGDIMGALETIWTSESLSLWDKLKLTFAFGAIAIWDWLKEKFAPLGEALGRLGKAFYDLWTATAPILVPVLKLIGGILVGTFLVAIKIATAAIDIFAGAIGVITAVVKAIGNLVIGIINAIIDIVNLIPFVKIPHIPTLQEGGIVTSPALAMVGEGGPEAIIPLDGFRGLDDIFGGLQTSDITLNVTVKSTLVADGREFAGAVGRQTVKQEIIRGRY